MKASPGETPARGGIAESRGPKSGGLKDTVSLNQLEKWVLDSPELDSHVIGFMISNMIVLVKAAWL